MVKNTTKRVMLTPAQQIAKAEADLAETRRKAYARLLKQYDVANAARAQLVLRKEHAESTIVQLDLEIDELKELLPEDVLYAHLAPVEA